MKTSKSVLAAVVLAAALCCSTTTRAHAAQRSDDDQLIDMLQQLIAQIALLEQRIQSLEARVATLEGGGTTTRKLPQPSGNDPIMRIESIEPMPADETLLKRAAALENEARACEKKAEDAWANERKYSTLLDRWLLSEDDEREKEQEYRRLRDKYRMEAKRLEQKARNLHRQAEMKRNEAHAPRHILRGWNGRIDIAVKTSAVASQQLQNASVGVGNFIEWKGHQDSADKTLEVWNARSLKRIAEPKNFTRRPANP